LAAISSISVETVRFDPLKMRNPKDGKVEYQQGELWGYEIREYLLEKWGRKCAYCGKMNVPLQIEHIVPKTRGGSDRVNNLTVACGPCNEEKGNKTAAEFGYPAIQRRAGQRLRYDAAVNTARTVLLSKLLGLGLPVEAGSGGVTKWNRARLGVPKTHWLDAVCVGLSTPSALDFRPKHILMIRATGHGVRQRVKTDPYGLPENHKRRQKVWHGFKTGDIARAIYPPSKKNPDGRRFWGRVIISSDIGVELRRSGKRPYASFKNLRRLHAADGYDYDMRGASQ